MRTFCKSHHIPLLDPVENHFLRGNLRSICTEGGLTNPRNCRQLCVSSERLIFLDTIGSTVLHRLVNRRKRSQKSKSCIVSWNQNYWTGNFEEKHLSHQLMTISSLSDGDVNSASSVLVENAPKTRSLINQLF